MPDIYLTIDLDYWDWDRLITTHGSAKRHAVQTIQQLLKVGCPINLYAEHHRVLHDFRKRTFARVINIDYHDDIVVPGDEKNSPMDASWVNYVPRRHKMIYEWRYPETKACIEFGRGLCSKPGEYLWPRIRHKWKYICRQEGIAGISWRHIKLASVILSPEFTCPMYVMDAVDLLLPKVKPGRDAKRVIAEWKRLFPF